VKCLDSLLRASSNKEIYVVDNGSSDGSYIAAQKKFQRQHDFRFHRNTKNIGFAAGVNSVIELARGEYVLVLNPDCVIPDTCLVEFSRIMDENPDVGISGPLVLNEDGTIQKSCRRDIPTPSKALMQMLGLRKLFPHIGWFRGFEAPVDEPIPECSTEAEGISGACMFVRKSALSSVGFMDERYFLHCEDLDWFVRFQRNGWKILFIPQIHVVHEQGTCSGGQPIRVNWYKHRSMLMFYGQFFHEHKSFMIFWAVAVGVWSRFVITSIKILACRGMQRYLSRGKDSV
jgi:GT2 family glycosyltransferase